MDNQNNQNNNPNNQNNNQNGPQKKQSLFMLMIAVLITIMGMSFFMSLMSGSDSEISYSEFLKMVKSGEVESVLITDTEIEITPKEKKV
ncbi:MAG: ATP-dependent metallopeptidase FtsH/Yme1/Tma family protein, partial [Lachnospiraceae bacterium]